MAVKRFSNSLISQSGQDKVTNFIAGYSPAIDEMDLIQRIVVPSGGSFQVIFLSIPQTYQHLQVRCSVRSTLAIDNHAMYMGLNNQGGTSNSWHRLLGDGSNTSAGSATSTSNIEVGFMSGANSSTNFGSSIIDILDYTNTSKNKVIRALSGSDNNGNGVVGMWSGMLMSTSSISRVDFIVGGGGAPIAQHSTFSLYGVIG